MMRRVFCLHLVPLVTWPPLTSVPNGLAQWQRPLMTRRKPDTILRRMVESNLRKLQVLKGIRSCSWSVKQQHSNFMGHIGIGSQLHSINVISAFPPWPSNTLATLDCMAKSIRFRAVASMRPGTNIKQHSSKNWSLGGSRWPCHSHFQIDQVNMSLPQKNTSFCWIMQGCRKDKISAKVTFLKEQ